MDTFASALIDSVPAQPDLLIAHSMGSFVCAHASATMRPRCAIHVDTPIGPSYRVHRDAVAENLTHAKNKRTLDNLTRKHPDWDLRDRLAEANAALLFDPATAASLLVSAGGRDFTPKATIPTMMIHAEPSRFISPEVADRLTSLGWTVRSITDADHLVWYGHLHQFLTVITEFAGPQRRWTRRLLPAIRDLAKASA